MKNRLADTVMIAQIDEKKPAMVPAAKHPPRKFDGLADVFLAELATVVRTVEMHDF